ncbi:MAG: bifunctional GTP diphosphokinase/guanosine-3',5'-bis pyrophosphate 3'-pyrophosphohydrolase [Succinivibrio sp.]|nr:bifunctional GTP diphosphokinase/guanosine-3',5'-bis pyrophosphate 3'-pyrophosphohydrolase [Succinivibrio sp.]MDY3108325.1 bifunctional GTP diphosphokinase/guanosine-3',5'-bis pyrophosphate 3'-pyrophosphohydrolase [Succinivibrio sp.]MDY4991843.1 bifunctional GTP diphosphokinase/guanosine-3',5'-bis pyrophosphate 3'-pyrophosphohydrolase [Succinivibrio sp.]
MRALMCSYLPKEAVALIDRTFFVADFAHREQKRASGEPYIIHPIAVATVIVQMHLDVESVQAALLHDVVEDTFITSDMLEQEFGPTVNEIVDGVTKLDKLRFHDYKEAQMENFRKMILAMTKDIRVILIKLADRTHNMRTLGALRPDKRVRIAKETLDVFVPIANRLGISDIRAELEELCMASIYPMRYRVLKAAVTRARNNRKEVVSSIQEAIKARLKEAKIEGRVLGREKRIFSIYKKMVHKELQFREIMDVYGFRIILKDVDTCYRVLGQMHNLFKPRPNGFKDYIAIPKLNGYQSLHTSLIGPHGVPIEIQIRTELMDQMAARGVAAHWAYKENGSKAVSTASQKNAQDWIKNLIDLQQSAGSSLEFVEDVKTDLFPDSIFVFTPDGMIYNLPKGATPVDFAYALHTDIGNHCIGARVNHHAFPLSRSLISGQTIEIITSPTASPNAIWLSTVVTSRARSSIRQYLKGLRSQECQLIGRRLLQNALRSQKLDNLSEETIQNILVNFKEPDLNALYSDIAMGNILTVAVAKFLDPDTHNHHELPIKGTGGMPFTFAQCCMPIPGDEIIAHIAQGRGIVIHTKNCKNLRQSDLGPGKSLNVSWNYAITANMDFKTGLQIEIENRQGIVSEISNAIDLASSRIESINSDLKDEKTFRIELVIAVRDRLHLASVIKHLRKVPNILSIHRRK